MRRHCVNARFSGLRVLLLTLGLLLASPLHAGLTETSAGELYARWQQLPEAEQLPALVELVGFYSRHDTARAIALAGLALQRTNARTEPAIIATLRNDRAFALFMAGEGAQALTEAVETESFADKHQLPAARGRALMIQGYVYRQVNLPDQALLLQQRALRDYEQVDDPERRGWVLKTLATLLIETRQFAQVELYIQQLDALKQAHPELPSLAGAAAEVRGLRSSLQQQHEQALQHYQQALQFAEQANDAIGVHVFHAAIGHELLLLNRYSEALRYAEQGLTLMQASGSSSRDVNLLRIKANALAALTRTDEASTLLLSLVDKATQRQDHPNLAILWDDLYQLEKKRQQWPLALHYLERARAAAQALTDENSSRRIALLSAAFNSERQNRQIELLQAENRVQQLELERQQQQLIAGISVALFLLGAASFFYLRRQHQHELQRQQQLNSKLRELDAIKDRMLANTSHELRTPLNGIVGLSDLLLAEELEPTVREQVELIADSGRRLTRVVTDLLESARLSEGQIRLQLQPVPLSDLVRHALQLCSPLAQHKQLLLKDTLPAGLPEVMVDPARVEQVLINMLNNAIKFTDHGTISIAAEPTGSFLKVMVNDTGIGIPADMQDRIFESFFQVDASPSRRYEGTGLGLAICKQLVEMHGGEIGVIASEGKGSSFWFTLPLAAPTPQAEP